MDLRIFFFDAKSIGLEQSYQIVWRFQVDNLHNVFLVILLDIRVENVLDENRLYIQQVIFEEWLIDASLSTGETNDILWQVVKDLLL